MRGVALGDICQALPRLSGSWVQVLGSYSDVDNRYLQTDPREGWVRVQLVWRNSESWVGYGRRELSNGSERASLYRHREFICSVVLCCVVAFLQLGLCDAELNAWRC